MTENEKIELLLKNEEFVKRIVQMTPEEVQKEFEAAGVAISVEEIVQAGKYINSIIKEDGELDENALENVAGGGKVGSFVAGMIAGGGLTVVVTLVALASW